MMKILAGIAGAVMILGIGAFIALRSSPALQDAIYSRAAAGRLNAPPTIALDDKSLQIYLCGTGSPMPDMSRANACTAIIAGGHIVLIDTGPSSWSRLAAARFPAYAIDTVLLTHLHSDHIGDLGEVAVQSWIAGRKHPLDVKGPVGTAGVVHGFAAAYALDAGYREAHHDTHHMPPEAAPIIPEEIPTPEPGQFIPVYDRDGLKISAFLVDHHPIKPAFGYKVEYGGRVAVLSGDTKAIPDMVVDAQGADVLIHEALNPDMVTRIAEALAASGDKRRSDMLMDTINYHASPVQSAEIARKAGVGLLVFSHIVPPLPNSLSRMIFLRGVDEAAGPVKTRIGEDGLLIRLPQGTKEIETKELL